MKNTALIVAASEWVAKYRGPQAAMARILFDPSHLFNAYCGSPERAEAALLYWARHERKAKQLAAGWLSSRI